MDCIPFIGEGTNCPEPAGPDFDFGQAPALFTVGKEGNGTNSDVVGAGQKSGQYWALNPDTGEVVLGDAGRTGRNRRRFAVGLRCRWQAGSIPPTRTATHIPLPLRERQERDHRGRLERHRCRNRGQLLWQTQPGWAGSDFGGGSSGPVTTANGVVFGCTLEAAGHMYALDGAKQGRILWSFASGGGCLSGAAIF